MKKQYDDERDAWYPEEEKLGLGRLLAVLNGDAVGILGAHVTEGEQKQIEMLTLQLKAADKPLEMKVENSLLLKEIDFAFSACTFRYYVWKSDKGGLKVSEEFSTLNANNVQLAMHGLILLLKANSLSLLSKCTCGQWYQAARKGQKACSTKCYLRRYQATEDAKAKRREYDKSARQGNFVTKQKGNRATKGAKHAKA